MMFLNFIYFFIGCLITFPLTHLFMKKGMMLDYNLTLEKQKDLSNAEIEELRRAWDGNVGDVDFSQRNIPVAPPQPRLDGSPISKYDLDRIQLEGRPQPGRDLESFNDVEMPDYNFRGYRNR